jgi:hypothetical protein
MKKLLGFLVLAAAILAAPSVFAQSTDGCRLIQPGGAGTSNCGGTYGFKNTLIFPQLLTATGILNLSKGNVIDCASASGAMTLTVPVTAGARYTVTNTSPTSLDCILDPVGSGKISGASTITLATLYDSINVYCDGTNCYGQSALDSGSLNGANLVADSVTPAALAYTQAVIQYDVIGYADGSTGTALVEHVIYRAPAAVTLHNCYYTPDVATVAASDTKYFTLTLKRYSNAGASGAVIKASTSKTTAGVFGGRTGLVQTSFGTLANTTLTAGQIITLAITQTSSGSDGDAVAPGVITCQ